MAEVPGAPLEEDSGEKLRAAESGQVLKKTSEDLEALAERLINGPKVTLGKSVHFNKRLSLYDSYKGKYTDSPLYKLVQRGMPALRQEFLSDPAFFDGPNIELKLSLLVFTSDDIYTRREIARRLPWNLDPRSDVPDQLAEDDQREVRFALAQNRPLLQMRPDIAKILAEDEYEEIASAARSV